MAMQWPAAASTKRLTNALAAYCQWRLLKMDPVLLYTAMANDFTVTSNPDPAQLQSLGVTSWPTWGCGVSTFPWT
jgi:hypothetical protein